MLAYLTGSGVTSVRESFGFALFFLGGSAPTACAYLAVLKTGSKGSLQEFHARVFKTKAGAIFYPLSLTSPFAIGAAASYLAILAGPVEHFMAELQPLPVIAAAFFSAIIFGGIEEFGWRGVLQHELEGKMDLFRTNLIIGSIWALWHLPLFFVAGFSHEGNSFLFFALGAIGYSAFMTFLYAKTRSVLPAVIFHASINASVVAGLTVPIDQKELYPYFAVFILVFGLVFLLARGRKG